MFETTIRVLGGLLSGHVLLAEDPGLAPGYDGLLLSLAADLGDRLLAAFDTPTGLPGAHVHLQKVGGFQLYFGLRCSNRVPARA